MPHFVYLPINGHLGRAHLLTILGKKCYEDVCTYIFSPPFGYFGYMPTHTALVSHEVIVGLGEPPHCLLQQLQHFP